MSESGGRIYLASSLVSSFPQSQDLLVQRVQVRGWTAWQCHSVQSVVLRATGILKSWTACPQQGHGHSDAFHRSHSGTGVRAVGNTGLIQQSHRIQMWSEAPEQGSNQLALQRWRAGPSTLQVRLHNSRLYIGLGVFSLSMQYTLFQITIHFSIFKTAFLTDTLLFL